MQAEDLLVTWMGEGNFYLVDKRIAVIGGSVESMAYAVRWLRLGRVHRHGRRGGRYVRIKPRNRDEQPKTRVPVKRSP